MRRLPQRRTQRIGLVFLGACIALGSRARAESGGTPLFVTQTGYLLNGADAPLTGTVALTFRIFDPGDTLQWEGLCAGTVVNAGYYTVNLGSTACTGSSANGLDPILDTSDLPATETRSLEVAIGGVTLLPRFPLHPAPAAARAIDASTLAGHAIGTSANGVVTLDSAGKLPAIDGSQLTNVNASKLGGKITGTLAGNILALDGAAKIPAVDGSQLTNVNAALLSGRSIGTSATNVVALDAAAKLPAVDGSQLTSVDAASIGGSTAVQVHSAELAANAATSANTANTLVKRDGSGNVALGTLTTTGVVTGALRVTGGSPATGRVLTSDASGNASWADPVGADTSGLVPLGTVISSLVAPDGTSDYMTGSTVWALADGTLPSNASTYTGVFPDLRGQFLRGMNAGRTDARKDPDTRTVGSQQIDALQGHRHSMAEAWGFTGSGSNSPPANGTYASVSSTLNPISDGTNGTPRTAAETRPGNVAVYWYVKVK